MSRELEEKVARAIAKIEGFDLPHDMTLPYSPGSRIGHAVSKARAAIAAVREELETPTPEMCRADAGTSTTVSSKWNAALWRAMLSASALGGKADG